MTDPVRPVAPREAEVQQLKTLNSALLGMIRRLQANLHFDPATRCYSVSEVAWFSQPYVGKTLAQWLDAELLVAAPVPCAASPADPTWEQRARQLLWLRHGCGFGAGIYGDDGEMQCNNTTEHRPLDFKREDWNVLTDALFHAQIVRATGEGARDADVDESQQGERGGPDGGCARTATEQGELHSLRTRSRPEQSATLHDASAGATRGGEEALCCQEPAEVAPVDVGARDAVTET